MTALDTLGRIWGERAPRRQEPTERRRVIREMAQTIVGLSGLVVMDTETTGTKSYDEVVEVAIVSGTGDVVLHSLVRPSQPIPPRATEIHGISNLDVEAAPTIGELAPALLRALDGKFAVAYNADFDFRLLDQSMGSAGLATALRRRSRPWDAAANPEEAEVVVDSACVMRMYAAWHGEWNSYHGNYAYQKLTRAVMDCGLSFDGRAHGALADARATLAVLRHMANADL